MKVLVDECAPRALKLFFASNNVESFTVQECGWSGKQNGALLDLAEPRFSVLITLDTNLDYQQNLKGRKIAIVVLRSRSNRLTELAPYFPLVLTSLSSIQPGEVIYVGQSD